MRTTLRKMARRNGQHPGRWVFIAILLMAVYSWNPGPFESTARWLINYPFQVLADATGEPNHSPVKGDDGNSQPAQPPVNSGGKTVPKTGDNPINPDAQARPSSGSGSGAVDPDDVKGIVTGAPKSASGGSSAKGEADPVPMRS